MIGKTLSHFRVLEKIGEGGMGIVYRAEDERLRRQVALKLLPPELVANQERRRRFLQEARAAAAVTHPNIATIYHVDEAEGVVFIAMELVEGKTLRDLIRGRPLPLREALRLSIEIAEGLAHAHESRVIHRDLKPDNVAVGPDGHPKILDFGLARLLKEPARGPESVSSQLETQSGAVTREPTIVGTVAYMSPEQFRGAPVDARSDIFSFGVTLYEMLTGRTPFRGANDIETLSAILRDEPEPPGVISPEVPAELERIIGKCLRKDPRDRYQHAGDIAVDLRDLKRAMESAPHAAPAEAVRRRRPARKRGRISSVAVLPLTNLSRDPEQDYFTDGMTEELIATLAKVSALRIISRTSVMRYKGTSKSIPEIARELGVDAVLEGSVRRAGERVRITAQLIEAATDQHLWAESYERDLGDILALQSELAQAVASEIRITLMPREKEQFARRRVVNPAAYEAYLRGRYHWDKRSREGYEIAVEFFERAVEQDPAYAPAYTGLADSYTLLVAWGFRPPGEAGPKAKSAALRALEIDDSLAEAHTSLGWALGLFEWDWSAAEREFKRATELNPNYAIAHGNYAATLSLTRRFEEAIREMEKARELDPLSLPINAQVSRFYYYARQYDRALEVGLKALEFDRNYHLTHWRLGLVYVQKAMYQNAVEALRVARASNPTLLEYAGWLAYACALSGDRAAASKILDEIQERRKQAFVPYYYDALAYLGLNENEKALEYLEKAFEQHALPWDLNVDPTYDPLRSDPRFQALLQRMGFEP